MLQRGKLAVYREHHTKHIINQCGQNAYFGLQLCSTYS